MGKKILVIDDEGIVTKSLQKLLRKEGYNAVVATSGADAIEQCKKSKIDLIISDIRMPQLDGIETIKRIRQFLKEVGKEPIPEILITGYADEKSYQNALELKVASYIYKPFDTQELLDIIKRRLNGVKE